MRPTAILLTAVGVCAASLPGSAQQHSGMPGMNMPGMNMEDTYSGITFRPGLSELMTAFVQPRHTKLGLAGAVQNWDLAAYELGELRDTFDGVGKLILKHGPLAIPQAIAATVKQPLDALNVAIKAKDSAGFTKAYADLATACNACHVSAGHPMIVIKVPDVSGAAYPDQDFNPPKK